MQSVCCLEARWRLLGCKSDGALRGREDAASAFAEIAGFLHKITSASQLRVEQRWQFIIYWAFREYRLIYRLYPPLLGDQIMLALA